MKKHLTLTLLLGLILACSKSNPDGPDAPNPGATDGCRTGSIASASPTGDMTTLIWSDEFEVDGAPCSENWILETVPPNNGSWWNNEEQYYTNRRSNSYVSNGTLKIVAKKENYENKFYTSARMTTQDLFEFQYGRVEIRAKLPQGQGTWPALWLLGHNIDQVSWPRCGEIDIMEHGEPDEHGLVASSVHQPNENGDAYFVTGKQRLETVSSEFHVYRMDWQSDRLSFFVDDVRHFSYNLESDMPFHQDFFMILNVAMGGNYTGNEIDPNFTSSFMEIDYVRVYQ